jgi:NADPH-ferrihemoprotein reductase
VAADPPSPPFPFASCSQERQHLLQQAGSCEAAGLGPAVLFFGCRRRDQDYIYQAELEGFVGAGALSQLHVAFSREGEAKDYVQHRIAAAGGQLWELLQRPDAHFYVCGDAKRMAKDVHRALAQLAAAHGGMGAAAAEAWVKQLSDAGRYQKDVW